MGCAYLDWLRKSVRGCTEKRATLLAEINRARDKMTVQQVNVCNLVLDEYTPEEIASELGLPMTETLREIKAVRRLLGLEHGTLKQLNRRYYRRR